MKFKTAIGFCLVLILLHVLTCDGNEEKLLTTTKTTRTMQHDNLQNTTSYNPCEQKPKLRNLLIATFASSVLIVGIIGNTIAIVVIVMSPSLLKQNSYLFIISLATADLCVSFFVTTIKVDMNLYNNNFCHGLNACYFVTFVDLVFPITSVLHLLVIAIDRAVAIIMPFFYSSKFSKGITKIIIVSVWLYATLWASVGMFPWSSATAPLQVQSAGKGRFCYISDMYYTTTVATVIYFVPMAVTTFLYGDILLIATKQAEAIQKLDPNSRKQGRRFLRDIRALKTLSIVFAAYTICWLPHFVIILVFHWSPTTIYNFANKYPTSYDAVTTLFDNVLPTFNSCINPFIYFLSSNHFRVALKDVVWKLLRKPRHNYRTESLTSDRHRSFSNTTKKTSQTSMTVNQQNGRIYIGRSSVV